MKEDPTIEEIKPFPLDPLPVEKRGQEPKVEKGDSPKERIDDKLREALRELHGLVDEGGIRVSLNSLEGRIEEARNCIGDALISLGELE